MDLVLYHLNDPSRPVPILSGWCTSKAVDFHLPNREQRIRPLQLSVVTAVITWLVLSASGGAAPPANAGDGQCGADGNLSSDYLALEDRPHSPPPRSCQN